MATLELRDEVDATHADESPSSPASLAAAIKEARDAIERSEELNKRLDPEEEPFRSKYLGREALKHAITKLEPHAEAGSDHASSWVARLEWRMGAVCQDVEETGRSVVHLSKALQIWRPRILDYVQSLPLDQQGKSTAGECDDEEDMTVAELAAYCAKQARKQAKRGLSIESSESSKLEVVELELEVVEAVSLLGIYHHNFEHHRQGLVLLKLAEALITGLETNLRAASASAESGVASGVASGALLALRTQVVFYLAQAYAALHRAHDSAHYCQQTLLFQLEAETKAEGPESGVRRFEGTKFNADEWYKNCAGLVNYFINQDRYRDAEQCLLACDAVVTRHLEGAIPPAPAPLHQMAAARERLEEAEADMNRRWGIFYLNILKDAALEFKDKEGGEIEVETEEPPVSKVRIDFKGLNLGPCTAPLVSKVTSFEAARDVFKLCGARLAKAKAYYQLDGFVTDHVALCKDASCAFKWLALFEQDEKRKTAMFGRALALLTPLLAQLGRQAYEGELKTLSWEAGEIATEMVEMKQERIAKKKEANPAYVPSRVEVQKSNAYCAQALEAFEKFAKFYRKAKPVPLFDLPKPGDEGSDEESEYDDAEDKARKALKRAEKAKAAAEEALGGELDIPDDELELHLRAHFYIARLHGKVLPSPGDSGESMVAGLRNSLKKYEWLAKFAKERIELLPKKPKPKTILDDPDAPFLEPDKCFKSELQIVEQMIELIPLQISNELRRGATVGR